ncbi:MAG: hypothetical protein HHJ12_08595 [Glaciimonas sp.]|nr:hypothetical protein [Glaciimonas sp.]
MRLLPGSGSSWAQIKAGVVVSATAGALTHAIMTMSKTDHAGLDHRARLMVKVENGKWILSK